LVYLLILFGVLTLIIRRRPAPGTVMGVFCLYYGVSRGLSDFLRVNDKTVIGLTGAQWMCVCLIPTGIWILTRVRKATAAEPVVIATDGDDGDPDADPVLPEPSDGEPLETSS